MFPRVSFYKIPPAGALRGQYIRKIQFLQQHSAARSAVTKKFFL